MKTQSTPYYGRYLLAACLLLLTAIVTHAQTNYIMKNDGSGTAVNTSMLFEYNSDYIGIGTVTPTARLHIHQPSLSPQPDYFTITRVSGYPTPVTTTYFTVAGDGNVGIGTATPETMLHLQSRRTISSFNPDPFSKKVIYVTNKNGDDLLMASDMSYNDGTDKAAGFLGILAQPVNNMLAFAVFTPSELLFPFSVLGDGTVALGIDINSPGGSGMPVAQLDIRKHNDYDYIANVSDIDNTNSYLTVHNDGYVGVGYPNEGAAQFQVISPVGSTGNAGVIITGDVPNDRYLFIGNGNSPGASTPYFSVKNTGVGIGIDDLSGGAQLAVKGSSSTLIDLMETSSTVTNNAQIRFIANNGTTVRHKITEDASGNLLIDAGVSAGSDKVKIDGDEDVTGNLAVTGTGTVTGAATLSSTLAVTGVASFANKVRIGTTAPSTGYTGYMLGVDGDIVAKKVIVQTSSWADKVFAPDYNLRSLADVETYINQNNHLPEIPSECEVLQNGNDVGEMNKLLLQKVEELTLYVIALQKQVDSLTKK